MNEKALIAGALAIGIIIVSVAIASFIFDADTIELAAPQGRLKAARQPWITE